MFLLKAYKIYKTGSDMLLKIRNRGLNYAYNMFILWKSDICTNFMNSLKCSSSAFSCKRGEGVTN